MALAVLTLAFNLDIGFVAITIGLVLSLIAPNLQKRAMGQVSWPEIVLITGVSTYVGVLQAMGTIDFVGNSVAGLTSPLMAALTPTCGFGAGGEAIPLDDLDLHLKIDPSTPAATQRVLRLEAPLAVQSTKLDLDSRGIEMV